MRRRASPLNAGSGPGPRGSRAKMPRKSLEPLSDQLQRRRQEMQQDWRRQVVEALDQATAETSRLAERQLQVQEKLQNGGQPRPQPGQNRRAIEEGVQKILDQVKQACGKNALVSPQIGAALVCRTAPDAAGPEAISSAAPNGREAADQAGGALDALNSAAHQLLRARDDVSGSQSGSGLSEALERMAQLAKQQGGLGQQGAGLLPMAGSGAIREQLQRLAARQRALAQELEKLRGRGTSPGAGQMADEADAAARSGWKAGRIDRQSWSSGSSGSSAGCSMPAEPFRGTRRRPEEGTAEHDRRPATASTCRRRFGPDWRMRTRDFGFRPGRSCSSSLRRSAGW